MHAILVSYPDPSTSQLRMDYITATLELALLSKVGLFSLVHVISAEEEIINSNN